MNSFTRFIIAAISLFIILVPAQAQWVQTNGPIINNVVSIAANGNTIIAGIGSNGFYRSTDNCESWSRLLSLPLGAINLFAKDGNYFTIDDSSIMRSTDNGTTWGIIDSGLSNISISYLVGNDSELVAATDSGVFLSSNNGFAWTAMSLPIDRSLLGGIVISDASAGIDSIKMIVEYNSLIFDTIYVSRDNGKSWTTRNPIIQGTPVPIIIHGNSILAFPPSYIGPCTLISTDLGASWSPGSSNALTQYIRSFAINGTSMFCISDSGIIRSMDSGASWVCVYDDRMFPALSLALNGTNVYAGTSGGVLLSTDNGTTWTPSNTGLGIPNSSISSIAVQGQNVFASASSFGVFSSNNGSQWQPVNVALTADKYVSILACNDSILFAGGLGLYRSSDNGKNWVSIDSGLGEWITPMICTDTCIVAVNENDSVFISNDNGTSWTQLEGGWYLNGKPTNGSDVMSIAICEGKIFIGTDIGVLVSDTVKVGIYYLHEWVGVNTGLTNTNITSLIACGSDLFAAANTSYGTSDIFCSTNLGQSWESIKSELGNSSVGTFAVKGRNIFAGTNGKGVFLSTDAGTTWTPINTGLTDTVITAIATDSSNVYIGTGAIMNLRNSTNGHGVWRRPLSEITSVAKQSSSLPKGYSLAQNYPNPFNPSTTISFTLPSRSFVSLKIFDVLGREVATIIFEEMAPGSYSQTWDAARLSSGIYFYRLQTGAYAQTKKLTLLK